MQCMTHTLTPLTMLQFGVYVYPAFGTKRLVVRYIHVYTRLLRLSIIHNTSMYVICNALHTGYNVRHFIMCVCYVQYICHIPRKGVCMCAGSYRCSVQCIMYYILQYIRNSIVMLIYAQYIVLYHPRKGVHTFCVVCAYQGGSSFCMTLTTIFVYYYVVTQLSLQCTCCWRRCITVVCTFPNYACIVLHITDHLQNKTQYTLQIVICIHDSGKCTTMPLNLYVVLFCILCVWIHA